MCAYVVIIQVLHKKHDFWKVFIFPSRRIQRPFHSSTVKYIEFCVSTNEITFWAFFVVRKNSSSCGRPEGFEVLPTLNHRGERCTLQQDIFQLFSF